MSPLEETLGGLAEAKKHGLAKHIGVSNFTVALIEQAVALCSEPLVCDQVEYHPYLDQSKVLDGVYIEWNGASRLQSRREGAGEEFEALNRIGRLYRKTPAQVSLRWLIQQNVVAIPRTSRIERLSENIGIFDFELTDEEMDEISAMGTREGRIVDFGFAPKWD